MICDAGILTDSGLYPSSSLCKISRDLRKGGLSVARGRTAPTRSVKHMSGNAQGTADYSHTAEPSDKHIQERLLSPQRPQQRRPQTAFEDKTEHQGSAPVSPKRASPLRLRLPSRQAPQTQQTCVSDDEGRAGDGKVVVDHERFEVAMEAKRMRRRSDEISHNVLNEGDEVDQVGAGERDPKSASARWRHRATQAPAAKLAWESPAEVSGHEVSKPCLCAQIASSLL